MIVFSKMMDEGIPFSDIPLVLIKLITDCFPLVLIKLITDCFPLCRITMYNGEWGECYTPVDLEENITPVQMH